MARTATVAIATLALVALAPITATALAPVPTTTNPAMPSAPAGFNEPHDADGAGTADGARTADALDPALSVAELDGTDEASRRTADEADAEPPGEEPVLLVHGFADTGYTPWWAEMTDNLEREGYEHGDVFVLNLGAVPLSTVDSPEDYGAAVCDAITTVKERTGASEVDVVAHSMGGLDARHCIEKQDGAEDVDDLVTLGTPHQVTYAATLAYGTPGGRDMIPGSPFLRDLNDGSLATGVEYTAVWSDWDELINPDEYAKLPSDERQSVADARNVFVNDTFHVQLVWDDDVFDAWIDRLD